MNFQEDLKAGQDQGSGRRKISGDRFPGDRELGTGTAGLLGSMRCSRKMPGSLPCQVANLWHLYLLLDREAMTPGPSLSRGWNVSEERPTLGPEVSRNNFFPLGCLVSGIQAFVRGRGERNEGVRVPKPWGLSSCQPALSRTGGL